jgi:hypothetical protein
MAVRHQPKPSLKNGQQKVPDHATYSENHPKKVRAIRCGMTVAGRLHALMVKRSVVVEQPKMVLRQQIVS